MTIRPMTNEDLDKVLLIEAESFKLPWTKDHFHYELHDNPYAFLFVAVQDGELLGFIDYWIMFEQATINQIAVAQKYRRRGIGAIILDDALNRMKLAEATQVSLEVRVSNNIAGDFYRDHGFKTMLTKPHYYEDGEDAHFMVKQI